MARKNQTYKKGELEAKEILEKIGYRFADYHDDNSQKNMPDFKCTNGDFFEITHTKHNHNIMNKFTYQGTKGAIGTDYQLKKLECAAKALDRRLKNKYDKNEKTGELTEKGISLHKKDEKLIKEVYGDSNNSEDACDIITRELSVENIINKILSKAKKHRDKNGKISLLIFATYE